jgi:hypothetical protein
MSYLDSTPDMETKLELIDTLRTVTDGKVKIITGRSVVDFVLLIIHYFARSMSKLNVHVLLVF